MSVIPPLSGPPLYRYIPGVGKVASSLPGPIGPTGPQGLPGTSGAGVTTLGNILRVDAVNGNDTTANAAPPYFSVPFLTIGAALAKATSGQQVWVLPGTYEESITIPAGVAVRGANGRYCIIKQSGSNTATSKTVVTMGTGSRFEDMDVQLETSSTTASQTFIGLLFPSGTQANARVRTVNVTCTHSGVMPATSSLIGVKSEGTTVTTYTVSVMFRTSATINVSAPSAASGAVVRGILNTGDNWSAFHEMALNATGSGGNVVGVENTNASGIIVLRNSVVAGDTFDIKRTAGVIRLEAADLIHKTAGTLSFSTVGEPVIKYYGVNANIANGTRYLLPGTVVYSNTDTAVVGSAILARFMVYTGLFQMSLADADDNITVNVIRSDSATALTNPVTIYSAVLTQATPVVRITDNSLTIDTTQFLVVQMVVTGNPGGGVRLQCVLGLY